MRPVVEDLRRHYFGAPTVPFRSYDKAVEWLQQQAVVTWKPNAQEMMRLTTDVIKAMNRFPKQYNLEFGLGTYGISFLKPKPILKSKPGSPPAGVVVTGVSFDKGSALEKLDKATESMSARSGCDRALCVAHVLSGAPLALRPLDWEISWSGSGRYEVTIQILQPRAVTLPVLTKAFRVIRRQLGLAKKKTRTNGHQRLLRLVEKRGGVPNQDKAEFWEDVRRAWNKAVPKGAHAYETWNGPMMAYRRLQNTLQKK